MQILQNLIFSSGERVPIEHGDIIVLVGPNNAGKSQALRDIQSLLEGKHGNQKVISEVVGERPAIEEMNEKAQAHCVNDAKLDNVLVGYETSVNPQSIWPPLQEHTYGPYLPLYLSYIKTEDRLSQVNPPKQVDRSKPETHPIHFLLRNKSYLTELSKYFKKAFDMDVYPDRYDGTSIPLRLGNIEQHRLDVADDIMSIENKIDKMLENMDRAELQGDGIRSFLGTALNLVLDYRELFLIDEPECFLHPPQARILGEVIGSMLVDDKTVVIATHSIEVLSGLLDVASNRVKIIRLTRSEDTTSVKLLENDAVHRMWSDSLLRYSDALDAIFYESAVICEADVDCRFYAMLLEYMKERRGEYGQTKFVACGGKDRLGNVAEALISLGVDTRVIPDLDILNEKTKFKELVTSCGGDWNIVQKDYVVVAEFFKSKQRLRPQRTRLLQILNESDDERISEKEAGLIGKMLPGKGPWSDLKLYGVKSVKGDQYRRLQALMSKVNGFGIFPVPVGELERFIPDGSNHSSQWLADVLAKHPSLADEAYREARDFVKSWNL